MRIGIDGRFAENDLGGIGKYIKNLVTNLASGGVEVIIFYSQEPKIKIEGKNIDHLILPYKNRYLFEQFTLSQVLKKDKIDLYHATGNIGIPWRCGIPTVLTIHDIIPLTAPGYFRDSKWPFLSRTSYGLRTITSYWKADKIITDTNFVKQQLISDLKIRENKVTVVNLAVTVLPGKRPLPDGLFQGKYLLNHGGIDQRKNLPRLIRVFSKLHQKFPDLKLVITGENPYLKPKLEEMVADLKLERFVLFPGYVDEETLWSLIRKAACICFPSLSEGFGAPVLEGFAAGTPVVCSKTTSLAEIGGEGALMIDPEDEKEIEQGIEKILTDKEVANDLVKEGLQLSKNYSWQKTAIETLKVYKKAIEKHL